MAKQKPTRLTVRGIDALPWAKRNEQGRVQSYSVRDTEVRGLMVVVHAQSKVFTVQRDLYSADKGPDGKRRKLGTRRVALGDVRDFGTVDDAREAARRSSQTCVTASTLTGPRRNPSATTTPCKWPLTALWTAGSARTAAPAP